MPRLLTIEEFHLTARVPRGLGDAAVRAARRALGGATLRGRLAAAVGVIVARYPSLRPVKVTLSR